MVKEQEDQNKMIQIFSMIEICDWLPYQLINHLNKSQFLSLKKQASKFMTVVKLQARAKNVVSHT